MCLATSNKRCPQMHFFPHEFAIFWSAKKRRKDAFFPHPPSPFPGNFCNCKQWCHLYCFAVLSSSSIVIHSGVKPGNAYSEIGPEVTLRPLAASCAKDYKGHSLVQTSFTEPPNRVYRSSGTCLQFQPLSLRDAFVTRIIKRSTDRSWM